MTVKNFNIKNGLSVGGVEVIDSSGNIAAGGVGAAVQEAIADKIGSIIQGSGSTTVTYDDTNDTITISSTGKTTEEIQDIVGGMMSGNTESGITVAYEDGDGTVDFTVSLSSFDTDALSEGSTNQYFTNARADARVQAAIDTDTTFASSSDSLVPSQLAVKTYVDAQVDTVDALSELSGDSDDITEGSTNVFFTNARADARVQAAIDTDTTFATSSDSLVPSQLAVKTYVDAQVDTVDALSELTGTSDDVAEGSSNLYYTDTRADARIAAADTDDLSEGSTNLYFTNARADARISNAILDSDTFTGALSTNVPSAESTKAYVDAQTTDETAEGSSNLYFTDARVMTSLATVDTHIVPTTDVTYDLGSTSKQWRDIYVGPGSLYVNGQQVVSDNSGTITVSADADQNVSVQTSGSGDIELDATGTGNIQIKAPMQIQASNAISSSDGNAIQFSNSIDVDAIESRSTDTNLVLTGNGTGNVTLNDDVAITGNLTVSGTTTTVNSETISLADNIIALNSNFTSGSPTEDTGISVTRGGSAAKTLLWDETNDKWTVGSETFVAGTFEGALTGNVTGNVSGSSGSTTGNAATATALQTSRTIGLSGDVSGSGSFDGTGNLTITATIADDSHNHVISNVDGLQAALDAKLASSSYTAADVLTKIKTVDGAGSGLDADLLDGQSSAYYQPASSALTTSTSFGGDVSGTYNAIVIADDSHNHTIANVDGLQTALNTKYQSGSNATLGTITTSNASNAGGYVRNIYQSTSTPSAGDGAVGDLWVYYS